MPNEEQIKYNDELLNKELEYIFDDLLNLEDKNIHLDSTNENITIKEILGKIKKRDIKSFTYQKELENFLLNDFFLTLKRIRDDLRHILRKKLINIEEVLKINKQLQEEQEDLIKEIEKRDNKIDKLQETINTQIKGIKEILSKPQEEEQQEEVKNDEPEF